MLPCISEFAAPKGKTYTNDYFWLFRDPTELSKDETQACSVSADGVSTNAAACIGAGAGTATGVGTGAGAGAGAGAAVLDGGRVTPPVGAAPSDQHVPDAANATVSARQSVKEAESTPSSAASSSSSSSVSSWGRVPVPKAALSRFFIITSSESGSPTPSTPASTYRTLCEASVAEMYFSLVGSPKALSHETCWFCSQPRVMVGMWLCVVLQIWDCHPGELDTAKAFAEQLLRLRGTASAINTAQAFDILATAGLRDHVIHISKDDDVSTPACPLADIDALSGTVRQAAVATCDNDTHK